MNKKNYLAPLLEMVFFHEDIVTTSIPEDVDGAKGFFKEWLS